MFRDMRRKNQQMSEKEAIKVLSNSSYGVLGLIGDGGYPYTVPLNYIFCDGKVYFHCASEGHKIDSVKNDDRASFCVVAKDDVVPSMLATDFCSVILFGRIGFVSGDDEKRRVLLQFVEKFAPEFSEYGHSEIEKLLDRVCILEFCIEHISGKTALKSVQEANRKTGTI